jgi:hypothetical protein
LPIILTLWPLSLIIASSNSAMRNLKHGERISEFHGWKTWVVVGFALVLWSLIQDLIVLGFKYKIYHIHIVVFRITRPEDEGKVFFRNVVTKLHDVISE